MGMRLQCSVEEGLLTGHIAPDFSSLMNNSISFKFLRMISLSFPLSDQFFLLTGKMVFKVDFLD